MRIVSSILFLLVIPLFSLAQNSTSPSISQTPQLHLSTSFSQVVTFGPGRVLTTSTQAIIVTITDSASVPAASGNSTGNNTTSGNSTTSATSTTAKSPLPTAPTNIDGGGQNGAPVPGASAPGGIYGPDDSYTAAALVLRRNAILVSLAGVIVGGALVLL